MFRITRDVIVDGSVAGIPYTSMQNEDTHLLRSDLRKDPSFSMSGTGFGVNAEAGLSYRVVASLWLDAGYRFWWLRVNDGNWTTHPVGSSPSTFNLNEFQSIRQGATLGLTFKF